jgi:hypothetical protein
MRGIVVVVVVLQSLVLSRADAQIIRGTVADASMNAALPGVFVVASPRAGGPSIGHAVTDSGGRFAIALRGDQMVTFRLVLAKDGFASDSLDTAYVAESALRIAMLPASMKPRPGAREAVVSSPGDSGDDQAPAAPPALSFIVARDTVPGIRVAPVVVNEPRACSATGLATVAARRLLDAVRPPLQALSISRQQPLAFSVARVERIRDSQGREEVVESTGEERAQGPSPNLALPADSLARVGYVKDDSTTRGEILWRPVYADLLLAPAFSATHCLRAIAPPHRADSAVAGIAFEPTRQRRGIADVEGVLWLNARGEPTAFEYRYVNVRRLLRTTRPGGRATFRAIPHGRWVIDRWSTTQPLLTTYRVEAEVVPGQGRTDRTTELVSGSWSITADVREVWDGDQLLWGLGKSALEVQVLDSLSHAPVARATVSLNGGRSTRTDSLGIAKLGLVGSGSHELSVDVPELSALGVRSVVRALRLEDRHDAPAQVLVPGARSHVRDHCGDRALQWGEGLVSGRVIPAPLADLSPGPITVSWSIPHWRPSSADTAVIKDYRRLDPAPDGRFSVCGVPRDANVEVQYRGARAAMRFLPGALSATVQLPE